MVSILEILGAIAAILLAIHAVSVWQFKRFIHRQIQALAAPVNQTDSPIRSLPKIVTDFAARSRPEPLAKMTRIHQVGKMRFQPDSAWIPFTADQYFAMPQPGFVWHARFGLPMPTTVIDSYVEGHGHLEARLLGSIPVAKATGPDADRGELMRYLAELACCPAALMGNSALDWRQLDQQTVEVSVGQGQARVSVRLAFDAAGDMVGAFTPNRPRSVGDRVEYSPWRGIWFDYQTLFGHRIPTRGEVSWELDTGLFTYWQAQITAIATVP